MQNFTITGLSHIVVLSGFNITVIVTLVFRLFSFLPRRWNFVLGSLVAILFVAMTGFSSTAVRALCMAGIVVAGQVLYRSSVPLMSLLVVCTIMVAWNPFILRDDVSFQLSALATLGIIVYGTRITDWFAARVGRGAGEFLGVTCAASIFTLPLIAYTFGTISLISPLANLLVLPLVQPAMALGALTGFIGMLPTDIFPLSIFTYSAYAFGLAAQSILALAFLFVDTLASIPYASLSLAFPLWAMVGCWLAAAHYAYTTYFTNLK
jgi:competence protein ComEC